MTTTVTPKDLQDIRAHLADQAFLYENPDAFEAGTDAVIDALQAVASNRIDRSTLADEHAGAIGAPGLVLELEDVAVSSR